ncbi:MAG: hypothetical protein NTY09_01180 [bacterium]|nr:hypothetical protein [bacterium]
MRTYNLPTHMTHTTGRDKKNDSKNRTDISPLTAFAGLLAMLVITIWILSPSLKLGLALDDYSYFRAPPLRTWSDLPVVLAAAAERMPRVLSHGFYYSVGQAVWGPDPVKWHIANFVLYAITIFVLYLMLARLLRSRLAALSGTLIYAFSGALFFAQIWITGSIEFFVGIFAFGSFLCHVVAGEKTSSRLKSSLLEFLALVLFMCAMGSKETALPLVAVIILYDLLASKRITPGAWVILFFGIVSILVAWRYLIYRDQLPNYTMSFNPERLVFNFLAMFFDPIFATGGDYWLLDRIGVSGSKEAAVIDLLRLGREHPIAVAIVFLAAVIIGIWWIRATIVSSPKSESNGESRALVRPVFGWLAWLLMLLPALVIPAHHYPYYLVMPLGFLMLAIGPAMVRWLCDPRWRVPVIIALIVYIAWFPINSALAFKMCVVPQSVRLADEFKANLDALRPDISADNAILVDRVDPVLDVALGYGCAIMFWYPGAAAMTFTDLHSWLPDPTGWNIPKDKRIIVVRMEDGSLRDVTGEFEDQIREYMESHY